MIPTYSVSDSHVMRRLFSWAFRYLGVPYHVSNFACAHPIMYMANDLLNANLSGSDGPESALLANWWFTMGTENPYGRDNFVLRFQSDSEAVSVLRPDGIVHVGLLIEKPFSTTDTGICLDVGVGTMNSSFGFHKFGPNIVGDGWFDPGPRYGIHYRYYNTERFLGLSNL